MTQVPDGERDFRRHGLLVAAGLALLALIVGITSWSWFTSGTDAYMINGVPLRQWLAGHPDFQIEQGLALLGTNALPHLTRIIGRAPESPRTYSAKQKIWNALPGAIQRRYPELRPVPDSQIRRTALFALRFMGKDARAALPDVVRIGRTETNQMVRASALVAALNIAPLAPETFALWLEEWNHTNYYTHRDLALYLGMPQEAIPAAIPYLLKELEDGHSDASITVAETLSYFGEVARPAVPRIAKMFSESGSFRGNLLRALTRLGPAADEGVPVLVGCLKEEGPAIVTAFDAVSSAQVTNDVRPGLTAGCLQALAAIGPAASNALPAIAPLLTNRDPTIRMLAAAAQIKASGRNEDALPILIAGVENRLSGKPSAFVYLNDSMIANGSQAAAFLLGEIGPPAREALPALNLLLNDRNDFTRIVAAHAIWRINGDIPKSLPVLLDALKEPYRVSGSIDWRLLYVISAIAEMGPAANQALPALEQVRSKSILARPAADKAIARIRPVGPSGP